jgi:hypothetical protein
MYFLIQLSQNSKHHLEFVIKFSLEAGQIPLFEKELILMELICSYLPKLSQSNTFLLQNKACSIVVDE